MNFRKGHVFWECLAIAFQVQEKEKLSKNRYKVKINKDFFIK